MRSRSKRSSTARKPRADWVYRATVTDDEGTITNIGSYNGDRGVGIVAGIAGVQALVLYDSVDYLGTVTGTTALTSGGYGGHIGRYARAEGRNAKILAFGGHIEIRPNAWAIGNRMIIGFRLGFLEQDPDTGLASVDPNYTMWDTGATGPEVPAQQANPKTAHFKEWRRAIGFSDNGSEFNQYFFWKGRRTAPSSKHALFLWCESAPGSATLSLFSNVRTLVVDEG